MRILLVEDDESMVQVLTAILAEQNYVVDVAADGEAGWQLVEAIAYDLVLLDVMLPKIDGISFCRKLRQRKSQVPVLLLTARDTTTDKLLGLDSGADDYVVKPFNIQELIARIRALLRRGNVAAAPILSYGNLRLDTSAREVTYLDRSIQFSRKEYLLLELLLRNQHRVFSRRDIVDQLWSVGEDPPDEDTVKSHVKNIRRELKAVGAGDLIETIYGQGYRLNPAYLAEASRPEAAPDPPQRMAAAVAEIWQRTKSVSLERVTFLEQTVAALKAGTLSEDLRQKAVQNAHKLVGSLGTFGFDEGSRLAQQLEVLFGSEQPFQNPSSLICTQQAEQLVAALHRELTGQQSLLGAVEPLPGLDHPLLLIIDSDRELAQSIIVEAVVWKLRAAVAPDLETARASIAQERPAAVLTDPAVTFALQGGQALLDELTRSEPPIPILVFSARDRSIDRVAAVKAGGQLFLQKPTTASQVLQAVSEVLQQSRHLDVKVLAVDDDPQILSALKNLLEPQGIHLTGLSDSSEFWQTLKSIQPDLLILDLMMPDVSGVELCQSVRQDFEWNWLPIVFLTARTDPNALQQIFTAGADDYVSKPIAPKELSVRVLNRLKRSQLLRTQAETDALTGIANRQQATQAFNHLLQLSRQAQQPLCLAVLDLDHFKQVNDKYGHIQGDRVLRQFGQFLKQKFRAGDVVARWGGEEFVVGIYGLTRDDGVERLAEILEEWRFSFRDASPTVPLSSANGVVSVTFSAGVAQYPIDGTNLQMLYRTADAALYRAKVSGRDRVLSAEWRSATADLAAVDVLLIYPDLEFAHVLLRALATRGYHAQWLQTGKAAVDNLKGKNPRLKARVILAADNLEDLDLLDLLKRLGTKTLKQTPTILLLDQPALAEVAKSLGASNYLLSPLSISIVLQSLRQALKT